MYILKLGEAAKPNLRKFTCPKCGSEILMNMNDDNIKYKQTRHYTEDNVIIYDHLNRRWVKYTDIVGDFYNVRCPACGQLQLVLESQMVDVSDDKEALQHIMNN